MPIYLLDAGGPALLFIPLVFFMLICGLLEGLIIFLFRIEGYWRAVGQALAVNTISLIAGFAIYFAFDLDGGDNELPPVLAFIGLGLLTFLIEALFLKLFNRETSWKSIWKASFVMNLITYVILFIMLGGINIL